MATKIPETIATIIAVVAVLEMNALITAETVATAAMIRQGRSPTQGTPSTLYASRRSSPCTRIASARMNEPIKRNTSGSANGRKTSLAGATPAATQATAPKSAVTGSGNRSLTHSDTTATRITASAEAS